MAICAKKKKTSLLKVRILIYNFSQKKIQNTLNVHGQASWENLETAVQKVTFSSSGRLVICNISQILKHESYHRMRYHTPNTKQGKTTPETDCLIRFHFFPMYTHQSWESFQYPIEMYSMFEEYKQNILL